MKQQGQFILLTRDEFKEWLLKQNIKRKITTIQNHHTAVPNYASFNGKNHFSLCEGMKNYHTKSWNPPAIDIAQNFTSFPDGTIVVCRSLELNPAGIYGANVGSICLEHVGFFDKDIMTEEHKKTIIFLNAMPCIKFNIVPSVNSILYHSWFNLKTGALDNPDGIADGKHKTCPGTKFFGGNSTQSAKLNFIPLVQNEVKNQIVKEVISMFKDWDACADWAKPSIERLEKLGLFKGDNEGKFQPGKAITKQELAVVVDRVLQLLGK